MTNSRENYFAFCAFFKVMTNSRENYFAFCAFFIALILINFWNSSGTGSNPQISLKCGICIFYCGLFSFYNLTTSINKFILDSKLGYAIMKKFDLKVSNVLDITAR
jgi:hypothetical protein